jgi:hypothetical protein
VTEWPNALQKYGDVFERAYWRPLLEVEFPEYAVFWERFVRPQREHPNSVRLRRHSRSDEVNPDNAVVVSQLHYSTFMHLACVFEMRRDPDTFLMHGNSPADVVRLYSRFSDAIAHLSSATDTADELLARVQDNSYAAWHEGKSQEARLSRRRPNDPMEHLHRYRNRLVHGPTVPHEACPTVDSTGVRGTTLRLPRFDRVRDVLDWRTFQHGEVPPADYATAGDLVGEGWREVTGYLRSEWASVLIPLLSDSASEPQNHVPKRVPEPPETA